MPLVEICQNCINPIWPPNFQKTRDLLILLILSELFLWFQSLLWLGGRLEDTKADLGIISNLHISNMAAQIPQNVFFPNKINIYFDSWQFIRCDLCIISPSISILSYRFNKVMSWSFRFVCLSVSRITYKVVNGFACMTLLSEVYLGARNNLIHFGDDPDYDPNPGSGLRSASCSRGLQSLTDCLLI